MLRRMTIIRRLPHNKSDSRRNTTRSPSRHNTRSHRPMIIHHRRRLRRHRTTTTGPFLPEDGSNNHCKHRTAARAISKRRWSPRHPTSGRTMRPKPATATHLPARRSSNSRNTTRRHHRRPRHRHRDRRDKTMTKTILATTPIAVPAMIRVAVRDIDWSLVLFFKRRGVQVAPGVFAFATPPTLAKSAREHHAAAI
jgi:hypothetical protein